MRLLLGCLAFSDNSGTYLGDECMFQSTIDISAYTYERTLMMEQRTQMLRDMRLHKMEVSVSFRLQQTSA